METGTYKETVWQRVKLLIQSINTKLEDRHYSVVCILALANFEKTQLDEFLTLHDNINKKLKLNPKYYNTLIIAAQLFTATEVTNTNLKYYTDFAGILLTVTDFGGSDSGGDGGGGD